MNDNIGNDDITQGKQENNFENDLNTGINSIQGAIKHGTSLKNTFDKNNNENISGDKTKNSEEQNNNETKTNDPTNKKTKNQKNSQSGSSKDKKTSQHEINPTQKPSEEINKKATQTSAEKTAQKAGEKTAEKVTEKGTEAGAEVAAETAGSSIAPGVGTVVGKAAGKFIVPIVKTLIFIIIIFSFLISFIIDSLPSYIFNPFFGLNEEERIVSAFKDAEDPLKAYEKANEELKKDITQAKNDQKLSGGMSIDTIFLYSCYSASMKQYEETPKDEGAIVISYKLDMLIKIIKVLPRAIKKAIMGETGSDNKTSESSSEEMEADIGGGDYTTGSITQLVNLYHGVDANYKPDDLEQTCDSIDGVYIRTEANQAYSQLWNAALEEGIKYISVSGFRSYELQSSLYGDGSDDEVAPPGHSEHQLGLALDLSCESMSGGLNQSFADTPEGKYLAKNAHRFGFIIRYPLGKEKYTGYPYEPWHIRYVGVKEAEAIYNSGLTMEGYYAEKSGKTITESSVKSTISTISSVTPFKKELFFEAFFGTELKLSDTMPKSTMTYEEYIEYLGEAMKDMLGITDGMLNIGGYGGIYAWPLDKTMEEYLPLADDEDWGDRIHPITGDHRFHDGIDLSGPLGTNIYAIQSGTVTFAGWNGGYGNYVRIDHGNGLVSFYGHLSKILVNTGDTVTKRQLIAEMGSTGGSTGSHLHLGTWMNGESVDPMPLFQYSNNLSDEDYNDLLRIVEAEAGGQGYDGKVAVTQVVMFRVEAKGMSYHDIIFESGQFSPISDGRFWSITVTDETIQAVNDALNGYQVVNPRCYFFYNKDASNEDWSGHSYMIFDRRVGDHEFFLSTQYS